MASTVSMTTRTQCSIPSLLPSPSKPRTPASQSFSSSSHSQFHGLNFSKPASASAAPVPSSFKTSIVAKVNKGQVPPNFTLKDQDGKAVSLAKYKGKPVVVYFYPADESPSCTKQVPLSLFLSPYSFPTLRYKA
ncbi:unnamed protein product [Linum tenue]|uniref:Peroxiredoxin Q, chloroplastic n=1 Tax=Linum tenue TaxID=586396 RepID=A0AAV0IQS0_9ROSI|nr:unnamed protein product [Linum tenue]